jgi:hypothetical protein
MEFVLLFALAVTMLALFDIAAVRWGVDSTAVSTDPRKPAVPTGLS